MKKCEGLIDEIDVNAGVSYHLYITPTTYIILDKFLVKLFGS